MPRGKKKTEEKPPEPEVVETGEDLEAGTDLESGTDLDEPGGVEVLNGEDFPAPEEPDEGDDDAQDENAAAISEEKRRTAQQGKVVEYNDLLENARLHQQFLASRSGRNLVQYLKESVAFAERKVLDLEKPASEYFPVMRKREAHLETLEHLKAPVKKFQEYAKSMDWTLFGGHVKHAVTIDPETLLITIDGPEEDLPAVKPTEDEQPAETAD